MVGIGIAEVLICNNAVNVCVELGPNVQTAIANIEAVNGPGIGLIRTGAGFLVMEGPAYIFFQIIRRPRDNSNNSN